MDTAEALSCRIWHLRVTGSKSSFSREYNTSVPKVKKAVTNAITAMYHCVIELDGR